MEMTLGDLRALVEDSMELDDSTPVRFASQPSWPFEYSISEYVIHEDSSEDQEDDNEDDSKKVVIYFAEGSQLGYLNGSVAETLGWR